MRFSEGRRSLFYAGVLMFLSIMTKQSTVIFAAGIFAAGIFIHRKNILYFALSLVPLTLFSFMALNELTNGWFWYLTFEMPAHHGTISTRFLSFFTEDILLYRLPLMILAVWFTVSVFTSMKKSRAMFYLFLGMSVLAATYLGRIKVGGATNVFIPFFIMTALFTAILFKNCINSTKAVAVIAVAVIIQSTTGAFNPLRYRPSEKIIKYSEKLLEFVENTKGDVLVLSSGYTAYLAGKTPSAHTCLINDMLSNKERRKEFSEMILDSFTERNYPTIVVREKLIPEPLKKTILKNYKKTKKQLGIVKWIGASDGVIEPADVFELKKGK